MTFLAKIDNALPYYLDTDFLSFSLSLSLIPTVPNSLCVISRNTFEFEKMNFMTDNKVWSLLGYVQCIYY